MTTNLLDLNADGLAAFCDGMGEKPFRARQIERWIHQCGEADFERIADDAKANCPISKALGGTPITIEAELA